ncbi:hypothetical protein BpHYR1_001885 [Brachionus plicatilis]|uniref:Uncharacterized protein n=1 Tax=Brachionus plicatilis TaxID=10195 RepID=A0A3M7SJ59_BRAPC|nr:hypothetical protein BpHYR1_001885 [Brachionus plicatilis]
MEPCQSSIRITKRKRDSEDEEEDWSLKKFKKEKIRHCIIDENLIKNGNWHQFFDNVRIAAVDPVGATKDGKVIPRHYHILGIPKVFKRAARDMRNDALEALGIDPTKKHVIQKIHYNWINDTEHFDNLVKYCKKKTVLVENENVLYESVTNKILDNIQKMKEADKFTKEEMAQFKSMYPDAMDWKKANNFHCFKLNAA